MPFAVYCGKCRANYGNTTVAAAEEHAKECPGRPLYKLNHGGLTKFGEKWFALQRQKQIDLLEARIKPLQQEIKALRKLQSKIRRKR